MITCSNCGTENPNNQILCMNCQQPLSNPVATPQQPQYQQAAAPSMPYYTPQYAQQPPQYGQAGQGWGGNKLGNGSAGSIRFNDLKNVANTSFQSPVMEASLAERNAIRVLKIFAWLDMAVSAVFAVGIWVLSALSANQLSQVSSGLAGAQFLAGFGVSVVIVLQGLFAWAGSLVFASMAESLITIRRNTARG